VKLEEDGLRAWDSLRSGEFDMLVTDNDMPGMTGLELAAKARLEGMRLPIILASGSIHLLDVADYGWLDFATLLKKPFSPDRLIEAVAKALCSSSGESRGAGVPALA
jgi:two-component system NtrC family sensor kinase